jgi:exoribonuclease R
MNYQVSILDREYKNIQLKNDIEELKLSIDDFNNFKEIPFFNNDIINYSKIDKTIISINQNNIKNKKIVGILQINKQMIYGFNNKKNPYFLFTPLSKSLPKFYVCINDKKLKNTIGDYYITIKFNLWNKKIPYGVLDHFIGKVGLKNNEIKKLLYFYDIDTRKYKLNKKYNVSQKSKIYDFINDSDLDNYLDFTNINTISIDPKDSRDIDDALSIEYLDNENKRVGIHIADVSFWYSKFNLGYYLKNNRYSTVYLNDTKFNLYPNILSDFLMSLIKGKDRLSLSLFIIFDKDDNITDYYFKNTIVNINRNFCYKKINNILKDVNLYDRNKDIFELFELSKKLKINKNLEDFDSHNMIENFMILSNQLTAEFLIKNKKNPILRYHVNPDFKIPIHNIKNNELKNFLKIYQSKAAEYKLYNDEEFNYYHYGLDLKYYTHYTSPIRRFPDLIIHMKIKDVLYEDYQIDIKYDINELNKVNKNLKKMDRQMKEIEIFNNIQNKTFTSYLINYKKNFLYFYIPEIKFFFKKKIFDNEDLLLNIKFQINDTHFHIINIKNNKNMKFEKYYTYKLSFNKINNSNEYNIIIYNKNFLELFE